MHQYRRLLSALWAVTALSILCAAAFADGEQARSEAAAHLLQAELALQGSDYLEAAREYRKAAEISESVDVARQATRVGYGFGFNEEALLAAKRWLELEPDSDEALLYVAQLQLRLGDMRKARRNLKKLIERGDEGADSRLLSLVQVLSQEDPEDADKVMRWLAKPYKKSAYAQYATAVLAVSGDSVYMRHLKIDFETGDDLQTGPPHLFAPMGFLDDAWWHRSYWLFGSDAVCMPPSNESGWAIWARMGNMVPSGRILSLGDEVVYGYGRDKYPGGNTGQWRGGEKYQLFACDYPPERKPVEKGQRPRRSSSSAPRRSRRSRP